MPSLTWRSSWRMVVYIYCITAAGNSIISQLGSSCQGNRYAIRKRQAVRPVYHIQNYTCRVTLIQPGGSPCWASPLAFGLTGLSQRADQRRWADMGFCNGYILAGKTIACNNLIEHIYFFREMISVNANFCQSGSGFVPDPDPGRRANQGAIKASGSRQLNKILVP